MTKKSNVSLMQRLLLAMKTGDTALIKRTADAAEEEVEAEKKKAEDEEAEEARKKTEDSIAKLAATVDALTATVQKMADSMGGGAGESSTAEKVETGSNPIGDEECEEDKDDEAKKKTACAMRDTVSRAEILVPGFKLPTADSAAKNMNAVVAIQRKVLADAIKTADGEKIVGPLMLGKTVSTMTADAVSTVFMAASELARAQNNARGARAGVATKDHGAFGVKLDNAAINAKNAEFWAKH